MEGAPVFAVEVRSTDDYGPKAEARMAQKRADYFAAGTLVIWDVDVLRDRFVRVYRASNPERPLFMWPVKPRKQNLPARLDGRRMTFLNEGNPDLRRPERNVGEL